MVIFSKQTTHSTTNDPVFLEHGFTQFGIYMMYQYLSVHVFSRIIQK